MQKNRIISIISIIILVLTIGGCSIEKISTKKTKDIDFTVVADMEQPAEVRQIVEDRKETPFKVTFTDHENTYIIIGYGKQNYEGYSIKVKEIYETKNAVCIKTEFEGPKKYTNKKVSSYPYIVIKIEYTDKNVVFSE